MKKMKMKLLGGVALALLGAGAIASIPIIMTSCAKKTDLSNVKFETNLGTIGLNPALASEGESVLDFIYGKFLDKNPSFDSEDVNYLFSGDVALANSLSLTLDAEKSTKYKGKVTLNLVADYEYLTGSTSANAKLSVSGYIKNITIGLGHKGPNNRPIVWTWKQDAPTIVATPTNCDINIKQSGADPTSTYFDLTEDNEGKINGGYNVGEGRTFSIPTEGSFAFIFTAVGKTSKAVEAFNIVVINWTHL